MGRENLQNLDATRGREPEMRKSFTINGRIFRFMESLHGSTTAPWDHEPGGVCCPPFRVSVRWSFLSDTLKSAQQTNRFMGGSGQQDARIRSSRLGVLWPVRFEFPQRSLADAPAEHVPGADRLVLPFDFAPPVFHGPARVPGVVARLRLDDGGVRPRAAGFRGGRGGAVIVRPDAAGQQQEKRGTRCRRSNKGFLRSHTFFILRNTHFSVLSRAMSMIIGRFLKLTLVLSLLG